MKFKHIRISDISVFAELPALKTLVLSEEMRPALDEIEFDGIAVLYE